MPRHHLTSPRCSRVDPFTESRLIWLDVARLVRAKYTRSRDNPRRQGTAISVLRVSPSPPFPDRLLSHFRRKKEVNTDPLVSRSPILSYLVPYGLVPVATAGRIILLHGFRQRPAKRAWGEKIITKVRRQPFLDAPSYIESHIKLFDSQFRLFPSNK